MGDPFSQAAARRLAEELFRQKPLWKSRELFNRILELHQERGDFVSPGGQDWMMRRAMQDLKKDALVTAPAQGWLKWTNASAAENSIAPEIVSSQAASIDEGMEDIEPDLKPEKMIGEGPECVYLYFDPNDRSLAELKGRDVWECKIGRTTNDDPGRRILAQGINTARSHVPILGLVLKTADSSALEKALHSSLRLVNAEVPDSLGDEWFITSPARVEKWYMGYQNALKEVTINSAG